MKRHILRAAAAVLSAVITITSASAAIFGQKIGGSETTINQGTVLSSGVWLNENTPQTEKYIEYTPGGSVIPIVAYGSKLYGRSNLDYVAQYIEEQGYSVVAGINGDFFELGTGISMGVVIVDGRIVADDNGRAAVGFYSDGSARMGSPAINVTVTYGDNTKKNIHINKTLSASGGMVLYTPDFGSDNKCSEIDNTTAVVKLDCSDMSIGCSLEGEVVSVTQGEKAVDIPEGCILLSTPTNSAYESDTSAKDIMKLEAGDKVTVSITAQTGWEDVKYAIGGGSWLVYGGQAMEPSDSVSDNITARTAIGLKADGTVVFYTIDEDTEAANGVREKTLAKRMEELGCTYAINLDGGGSTTMAVRYPGTTTLETINTPSDGSQRKCANYLFLVNTAPAAGETSKLFLYPSESWMLKGAKLELEVAATDNNWQPSQVPIVVEYDGGQLGTIDEKGVFTAENVGSGLIHVHSLGMTGSATVNIISDPTSIIVSRKNGTALSSLTVAPAADIQLIASAKYRGISLLSSNSSFTWQVNGGVGTIDAQGCFKAAYTSTDISGSIVVSCGSVSVEIPVKVSPQEASGMVVQGFEANTDIPESQAASLMTAKETDLTKVKYGYSSLRVTYDLSLADSETPPSVKLVGKLSQSPTHLSFWVYGDGSGNSLNIITSDAQGNPEVHSTELSFTGWKYITVPLAEGSTELKGLGITKSSGSAAAGTIWVDQILASSGAVSDTTPPEISGQLENGKLTATIKDNGATAINSSNITLTVDGKTSPFSFGGTELVANLSFTGSSTHRVRLTVVDACGNISSASFSATGDGVSPFADMSGHWADSVVTYLYDQGIISGMKASDGSLVYEPDSEMTREQFAVIVTSWLGTDLTQYENVTLPFNDCGDISYWSLSAVKAAYSLGIIKGDSSGGVLNFNPQGSLTRAEAMTIIGRTQPKGYAEASLDQFADNADIPTWAADYISTLISQNVVSGSNGYILPNGHVTRSQVAKMLCMLM